MESLLSALLARALSLAAAMSSTYVHYSTPSSLPSDYAVLSRYAAAHDQNADGQEADSLVQSSALDDYNDEHDENGIDIHAHPRAPRRRSSATSYLAPFNPTMGPLPDRHGHRSGPKHSDPNENTPLLAPPVPRIEEECDREDATGPTSSSKMFWEEMGILAKYTLPVFGYVYFCLKHLHESHTDMQSQGHTCLSSPSLSQR